MQSICSFDRVGTSNMKPFRVAHLINDHLQYGGTERVASNLTTLFRTAGIDVPVVFSFTSSKSEPFYNYGQATQFFQLKKDSPQLIKEINAVCRQFHIDVLIIHGYHLLFFLPNLDRVADLIARVILVTHFSSRNFMRINPKYPLYSHIVDNASKAWSFYLYQRPFYRKRLTQILEHGRVVCVSEQCSLELKGMFRDRMGFQERIQCIYNPIILPQTIPTVKENIVLYASRLREKKKNSMLVVKAWAKIFRNNPGWQLLILGDGELRNDMLEYVRRNRIGRITFGGVQRNITPYLQRAQISICSSNSDALPQSLVEAAYCGNALVSTAFDGGVREIVYHGLNGYVVPKNSHRQLAHRIEMLLNDSACRKIMQDNSRYIVHRFNSETILSKWLELISLHSGL